MKESFYFSHDYNSRTDPKIKKLLARHGMLGFGVWWAVLEDLYNNANALQMDIESIAYDLRVDCDIVKSVIFDFNLFIVDDNIISSRSVKERMDRRIEKSAKASLSAKARWDKSQKNANALRTHSDSNAIKESKVKDSIVKENKEEETPSKKMVDFDDDVDFEKNENLQVPDYVKNELSNLEEFKSDDELIGLNGTDRFLKIGSILLKNNAFSEKIMMINKFSIEDFSSYMQTFISEKIIEEKTAQSVKEFKGHFMNWVKKRHEGELKSKSNGTRNSTYGRTSQKLSPTSNVGTYKGGTEPLPVVEL